MCALYALCAGAAAHRHYNCKKSKSRSGTVNDNKTVYISLEALALSAVSTSKRQFHNKNKEYYWPSLIPTYPMCLFSRKGVIASDIKKIINVLITNNADIT